MDQPSPHSHLTLFTPELLAQILVDTSDQDLWNLYQADSITREQYHQLIATRILDRCTKCFKLPHQTTLAALNTIDPLADFRLINLLVDLWVQTQPAPTTKPPSKSPLQAMMKAALEATSQINNLHPQDQQPTTREAINNFFSGGFLDRIFDTMDDTIDPEIDSNDDEVPDLAAGIIFEPPAPPTVTIPQLQELILSRQKTCSPAALVASYNWILERLNSCNYADANFITNWKDVILSLPPKVYLEIWPAFQQLSLPTLLTSQYFEAPDGTIGIIKSFYRRRLFLEPNNFALVASWITTPKSYHRVIRLLNDLGNFALLIQCIQHHLQQTLNSRVLLTPTQLLTTLASLGNGSLWTSLTLGGDTPFNRRLVERIFKAFQPWAGHWDQPPSQSAFQRFVETVRINHSAIEARHSHINHVLFQHFPLLKIPLDPKYIAAELAIMLTNPEPWLITAPDYLSWWFNAYLAAATADQRVDHKTVYLILQLARRENLEVVQSLLKLTGPGWQSPAESLANLEIVDQAIYQAYIDVLDVGALAGVISATLVNNVGCSPVTSARVRVLLAFRPQLLKDLAWCYRLGQDGITPLLPGEVLSEISDPMLQAVATAVLPNLKPERGWLHASWYQLIFDLPELRKVQGRYMLLKYYGGVGMVTAGRPYLDQLTTDQDLVDLRSTLLGQARAAFCDNVVEVLQTE
jgi:hypothetical protein